jgi:hypothetical protein
MEPQEREKSAVPRQRESCVGEKRQAEHSPARVDPKKTKKKEKRKKEKKWKKKEKNAKMSRVGATTTPEPRTVPEHAKP